MVTLVKDSPTQLARSPNQLGDLPPTARRHVVANSRTEELIGWSTDANGMDREAMENVNRDGWGIER